MTATSFATGDPRTQKIWSKKVFKYAMQNIALTPLMGKNRNSLIQVENRLLDESGDTIVFKSKSPMSGAGQGDGGTTTGNEEALKRRNMSLVIHERAHSFVSDGPISEQRTDTKIREDGKEDLGDWWAEALENDLITAMCGLYNENSSGAAIETINETYPSKQRIYYGGNAADGTQSNSGATYGTAADITADGDALMTAGTQANNMMGTKHLSMIKRKSLAATPRFRPVIIRDLSKMNPDDVRKGVQGPIVGKFFLVLMHPLQVKSVKAETGTSGWATMTSAAQVRGNLNPIFSGAAFLWDGMVVWEYDRIPTRTGAGATAVSEGFLLDTARTACDDVAANGDSIARAVLCGAQAMGFGWGQRLKWHEDMIDARKPKVVVDALYGVKRTQFNAHGGTTPGQDEAIYCMDTEVVLDG